MGLSLDKILQLLSNEMPGLMPGLEPNKDKVNETLESLSLQRGESYLSMGIGKNILPAIVALHGVDAVGFDIDKDALQYQKEVSARLALPLHQAKGSLNVYNFNFDDPYTTQHVDGFEAPSQDDFYKRFDIVECVYFGHREGESDLAQILFNFAKQEARYLVSTPGGLLGKQDRIVTSLTKGIERIGGKPEIIATDLYSSNGHNWQYGVVVKSS